MDVGDIVSTAFGLVGSLAGICAVLWVYKRERAERKANARLAAEKEAQKDQRKIQSAREQKKLEEERRARDVRRTKHEDDYRLTMDLLERLKAIAYSVEVSDLITETRSKEKELRHIEEELERLSDRLPRLDMPLTMAYHMASGLEFHTIPDEIDSEVRRAIWHGVSQYFAAKEAGSVVKRALEALNKEWEA
ncbi:hypothetical protein [Actinomadura sp. GTD37]|uniref:hypothetical protein n=1 Tax=Actinomadura sp. GTD37 TaxID=1778030 RepID=UPI0035C139D2